MKIKCTRGFGVITDPQSGEAYNVEGENEVDVDPETAERLKANFSGIVITETESVPDFPTNEDGEPLCVGKEEGQCSRVVDEPGGTCWQH